MTSLETFLRADDLDALLRAREEIGALTPEESARVVTLIHEWSDRQAVANLLFHPLVMPASIRFEALDRALHSPDVPYLALAATVGLQDVAWADVPNDKRETFVQALLRLVQSTSNIMAGRASVTLSAWLEDAETSDILRKLVSLYPVPDQGASRNIVAVVLATCGDMTREEFGRRLADLHVSSSAAAGFRRAHDEYVAITAQDEFRATLMKVPGLAHIPNLSDGVLGRGAGLTPPGVTRKPWWRFW